MRGVYSPALSSPRAVITVHPHVRGVYFRSFPVPASSFGSSPRAWGIHSTAIFFANSLRFIPTCVGYTCCTGQRKSCRTVHPHVRGVYASKVMFSRCVSGSSPRAWGIRHRPEGHRHTLRFIPTCVGYTCCWRIRYRRTYGSSPRAWGIRLAHSHQSALFRFIPTCVGYTVKVASFWWLVTGSSPRAWGIPSGERFMQPMKRFIPTCVGYTISTSFSETSVSVHPHVRGVYVSPPVLWPASAVHPHVRGVYENRVRRGSHGNGSSPRAWGILFLCDITPVINRFIPTCVGYTILIPEYNCLIPVHPHVRGVYDLYEFFGDKRLGSSPRAWGILIPPDQ